MQKRTRDDSSTVAFQQALRRQENVMAMSALHRHQKFIRDYRKYYGTTSTTASSTPVTEMDIVRKHHRFLRTQQDDQDLASDWERRIAKKYYDKLFKEYCLVELAQYERYRVALRWRTEKELISGKGQFTCGALRCDEAGAELRSWEVPFSYKEAGARKQALVKVRLCPDCSRKLHYARKFDSRRDTSHPSGAGAGTATSTTDEPSGEPSGDSVNSEKAPNKPKEGNVWAQPTTSTPTPTTNRAAQQETRRRQEFDAFFAGLFE